jgi:DNA polymerase-3 subunit epsilon
VAFLNAELERIGRPRMETVCTISDTLEMARDMHPGKKNSLDALCERYAVDHSKRTLHGALLDAQLLADVWIAMTRGQETLDMAMAVESAPSMHLSEAPLMAAVRVLRASAEELAAHAAMCERIARESRAGCLWMRIAPAS